MEILPGIPSLYSLVESCREQGVPVRTYGEGFLQLEVSPNVKVNFWEHPTQIGIHTHKNGFTSKVLLGVMGNNRWQVSPSWWGKYQSYVVQEQSRGKDTTFEYVRKSKRVNVQQLTQESYSTGGVYSMLDTEFHSTQVIRPTITLLQLDSKETPSQQFLVPRGKKLNRKTTLAQVSATDMTEAWGRIYEMVKLAE